MDSQEDRQDDAVLQVAFWQTKTLLDLISRVRSRTDEDLFSIVAAVFTNTRGSLEALKLIESFCCEEQGGEKDLKPKAVQYWKSIVSMKKHFQLLRPTAPVSATGEGDYGPGQSDECESDGGGEGTSEHLPPIADQQLYGRPGMLRAMEENKNLAGNLLRYYASVDSEEEYRAWAQCLAVDIIRRSDPTGESDWASALYELFRERFVCSASTGGTWYSFNGVFWVASELPTELLSALSETTMTGLMSVVKIVLQQRLAECLHGNSVTAEPLRKQSKAMERSLKTEVFARNVVRSASRIFEDRKMQARLDLDPNLMAFQNGILDLNENKATLRPGRPVEFLSRSSSMVLDFTLTVRSPIVVAARMFLKKLFPDEELYTFFLLAHCTIFDGANYDKVCKVWEGSTGSNGKSTLQGTFEAMLGAYSLKTTTALLTGKKPGAGQANPDLARAGGGVRDLVCDEPDSDELLNCGTVKAMTGNDSFAARDLYQKGGSMKEVKPTFHLRLIGNLIPECTKPDQAFLERLLPIPFKSEFLSHTNYTARMEMATTAEEKRFLFVLDPTMDAKGFAPGLAFLLLDMRGRYLSGEIPTRFGARGSRKRPSIRDYYPDEVMEKKKTYARDHDMVGAWVKEKCTQKGTTNEDSIDQTDAERRFKEWSLGQPRAKRAPKSEELVRELKKAFGWAPTALATGGFGWLRWMFVDK